MTQTVFLSARSRLVQAIMNKPLLQRTPEELFALAKDIKIPVPPDSTKEQLITVLTNASRSAVPTPRKGLPDTRAGVLHDPKPAPVQEGGTAPEGTPGGEQKPVPEIPLGRRSGARPPSPESEE